MRYSFLTQEVNPVSDNSTKSKISRRKIIGAAGTAAAAVTATPLLQSVIVSCAMAADEAPLNSAAGLDRVTILPGKTYLRGWAGYGSPPKPRVRVRGAQLEPPPPTPTGPALTTMWSKESGPGPVTFSDAKELITTAR